MRPDGANFPTTGQPTGSPADPYAWFNLLPRSYVNERPLSFYAAQPGGNALNKFPPFNYAAPSPYSIASRIWECPSADMTVGTAQNILSGGGADGFFSYYDMND